MTDPQYAGTIKDLGLGSLTSANTSILTNDNGTYAASVLGEKANAAQVGMAVDLANIAHERGLSLQVVAHSNGTKGASEFFAQMGKEFSVSNSVVIAPNTSKVCDLASIASQSNRFTLVSSNKDGRLGTPGGANIRMEKAVGNLKYGSGFRGDNYAYKQTFQSGHGAQHYFGALRDGPVKVYK